VRVADREENPGRGWVAPAILGLAAAGAAWKLFDAAARLRRARAVSPGTSVLILGGGFAGVHVARALRRLVPETALAVTIVSDSPSLVFTPLLAEAAGGEVAPDDALTPLQRYLPHVRFVQGRVTAIDLAARSAAVETRGGPDGSSLSVEVITADHLVIALGSETDFHGIPGLREHALVMNDAADADGLHRRLPDLLRRAREETDADARGALLTLVVGGAGFTGVETMAAVNAAFRRLANIQGAAAPGEIRTVLVDAVDRLLPQLSADLSAYAERELRSDGVEVRLSTRVTGAGDGYVEFDGRDRVSTRTLIWAGGIEPPEVVRALDAPHGRGRALAVDACLRLPGRPGVWAVGDSADIPRPGGGSYAPLAQNAEREGAHVAENIVAELAGERPRPFSYHTLGQLALVGPHAGVADLLGLRVTGLPAWLLWHAAYLTRFPTLAQRLRIGMEWLRGAPTR
jgi:NADH dehydrogenase